MSKSNKSEFVVELTAQDNEGCELHLSFVETGKLCPMWKLDSADMLPFRATDEYTIGLADTADWYVSDVEIEGDAFGNIHSLFKAYDRIMGLLDPGLEKRPPGFSRLETPIDLFREALGHLLNETTIENPYPVSAFIERAPDLLDGNQAVGGEYVFVEIMDALESLDR